MESKIDSDNIEKWARSGCQCKVSKIHFEEIDGFKVQAI